MTFAKLARLQRCVPLQLDPSVVRNASSQRPAGDPESPRAEELIRIVLDDLRGKTLTATAEAEIIVAVTSARTAFESR